MLLIELKTQLFVYMCTLVKSSFHGSLDVSSMFVSQLSKKAFGGPRSGPTEYFAKLAFASTGFYRSVFNQRVSRKNSPKIIIEKTSCSLRVILLPIVYKNWYCVYATIFERWHNSLAFQEFLSITSAFPLTIPKCICVIQADQCWFGVYAYVIL